MLITRTKANDYYHGASFWREFPLDIIKNGPKVGFTSSLSAKLAKIWTIVRQCHSFRPPTQERR